MSFTSCPKISNQMMVCKRGTIVEELVSCRQMMQQRKSRCRSMENIKNPKLRQQQQPPLSAYKAVFDYQDPHFLSQCTSPVIDRDLFTKRERLQYLATPKSKMGGVESLKQGPIKACSHRQAAVMLAQKASKLRALPKEFLQAKAMAEK